MGPTVRRFQRERRAGQRLACMAARRFAGAAGLAPAATAPVAPAPVVTPAPMPPPAVPVAQAATFPLGMATILGLDHQKQGLVVLDGRIGRLRRSTPAATTGARPPRNRWTADCYESLPQRLQQAIGDRRASLEHWVRGEHDNVFAHLDRGHVPPGPEQVRMIDAFVHDRLVPALRQAAGTDPADGAEHARPQLQDTVAEIAGGMPGHFAITDQHLHRLVPFCGTAPPGQLQVEDGDTQDGGVEYVGVDSVPVDSAMAAYDEVLRESVLRWLAGDSELNNEGAYLYKDDVHAVIRTPGPNYFLSRQIPPYVVEGDDRKLYSFPGARLGIRLLYTSSRNGSGEGGLTTEGMLVLHPYRHMFAYTNGHGYSNVCMPRSRGYFRDLEKLPMAEALLRHLESARMTLCAGYNPAIAPFHPIQKVGRNTITPREARRQQLPIYRFFPPRKGPSRRQRETS